MGISKLKIRKDDEVMVISGNYKGSTGRVLEVYPKENRALVEGVNIRKKHTKPNPQNQKGGILSKEAPIDLSNLMLMDSDGVPTRIGFREEEVGGRTTTVRYAKTNDKRI